MDHIVPGNDWNICGPVYIIFMPRDLSGFYFFEMSLTLQFDPLCQNVFDVELNSPPRDDTTEMLVQHFLCNQPAEPFPSLQLFSICRCAVLKDISVYLLSDP